VLITQDNAINNLNLIHVSGTKGKGATSAFTESFLRAHGKRTGFPQKTGLYTSPHLVRPEERIRINFEPLSQDHFTKYFFEVYDCLSNAVSDDFGIPRTLQLFALISFHAFIREDVDVAIYETHHGGEYDATNVISRPVVTAVTTLGMDHVNDLGPTLEDIAWHKAGIFKPGAIAFSAPQKDTAAEVLRRRAVEKGVLLEFIQTSSDLPQSTKLAPAVQKINCSLAIATANGFLKRRTEGDSLQPADIEIGLDQYYWPGRFEIIRDGQVNWCLDGAHNEVSVSAAAEWFTDISE
jgi:folylpolyglutamate synthase